MEAIEKLLREKTYDELDEKELVLIQDLFEDKESYNGYRSFLIGIIESEDLDFPEEIDNVIYGKLQEEEKKSFFLAPIFKQAALALVLLGVGFLFAWFFKPNSPNEIITETIIIHDTIQTIQTEKIVDTLLITQRVVELKTVEVLVYENNNSALDLSDSLMLFADSVAWEDDAIVLNNNLKDRQDLNVFYAND